MLVTVGAAAVDWILLYHWICGSAAGCAVVDSGGEYCVGYTGVAAAIA